MSKHDKHQRLLKRVRRLKDRLKREVREEAPFLKYSHANVRINDVRVKIIRALARILKETEGEDGPKGR